MKIKDIAKLAGVSPSTVSKIINKKDDSISADTREHVLKIVNEYNYVPYSARRNLPNTTGLIGILRASSESSPPFLEGILEEIQNFSYSPLLLNSYGDVEEELKNLTLLVNKGVEGIIYQSVTPKSESNLEYLENLRIPYLDLDELEADPSIQHPFKILAHQMTNQLLDHQHEKIACLVDPSKENDTFIKGYQEALTKEKIDVVESLIFTKIDETMNDQIIQGEITAFIVKNEQQAIELERLAGKRGLKAPEDYSLLTVKEKNSGLQNHLSSYTFDAIEFGRFRGRQLINQITGAEAEEWNIEEPTINHFQTIAPFKKEDQKKLLVIGSINIDTYLYSDVLPKAGIATFLRSSQQTVGGKAFNQALGVSKLGHEVHLIGMLGKDQASNRVFQALEEAGISTNHLKRSPNSKTGQAYISVDQQGDSLLSILPGANADFSPDYLNHNEKLFSDASFCLIQTEIPIATIERAVEIASKKKLAVILKPSGIKELPDSILEKVDYLIPNEGELFRLVPNADSLAEAADVLLKNGVQHVLVTLGNRGSFLKTSRREKYYTAADFTAVDTTGAGDAFISAFASYLTKGYSLDAVIQIANLAAGFSVSRDGVGAALATEQVLNNYLMKNKKKLRQE